jgi:hypothetical protein
MIERMRNLISAANWMSIVLALTAFQSVAQSIDQPYTLTTLAGGGGFSAEGKGSAIRLSEPFGVAVDAANNVFVADTWNHAIRKVTPSGEITTLAGLPGSVGSADGPGNVARFNNPNRVAVDNSGNVYVADTLNHTVRKVTPEGVVTTLAGLAGIPGSANGTNSAARFRELYGVAVDGAGNVYVADSGNDSIRKVAPVGTNWVVTTIVGRAGGIPGSADGTNGAARFNFPTAVAVDKTGKLYVADTDNHTIRQVISAGTNWVVTTIAGQAGGPGGADGTSDVARFRAPFGIAVDGEGNVYVGEGANSVIRRLTRTGGSWVVTTPIGLTNAPGTLDGTNSAARINSPVGLAADQAGNLYVAEEKNDLIRKVTLVGTDWVVTTVAGLGGKFGSADSIGIAARFAGPSGVTVDAAGNVYVADQVNNTIRKVTANGVVSTLAGLSGYAGSTNGRNSDARFNYPSGVTVDGEGNLYVIDTFNDGVRRITPIETNWVVTTLAGGSEGSNDGVGAAAQFTVPKGVAVDRAGNIYVADTIASTIRKVTPGGSVSTLAGQAYIQGSTDGTGAAARFNCPGGLAVDNATNVYVADTWNHTIRKISSAKVVTTIAGLAGISGSADGTGTEARFHSPSGLAVDSAGNIYVADTYNNTIRKLAPSGTSWLVTTLGGLAGSVGTADGTGSAARFGNPNSVAVDIAGNLYVADFYFNTIRKGYPPPRLSNSGFAAGQFRFDLTGPPGQSVIVETSSDLLSWLPIWTNTSAGTFGFSDPQTGVSSKRFYRARLP